MAGIAEILHRAIQASDLSVREEGDRPPRISLQSQSPSVEKSVGSWSDEDRVIRYLWQVGEATPAALRTFLRLPKTSAFLVLNRLGLRALKRQIVTGEGEDHECLGVNGGAGIVKTFIDFVGGFGNQEIERDHERKEELV